MHEHIVLAKKRSQSSSVLLLGVLMLSACVFTTPDNRPTRSTTVGPTPATVHSSTARAEILGAQQTTESTVAALYSQLNEWRGTPYLLGGNSKHGIDCSSFVKRTFAQHFQRQLPRTTKLQVQEGRKISRTSLQPGDLVFFKTGFRTRHVGVYVDDGNFVHASNSAGVTLSNINNTYWKSRYWQSRRLPIR